jgi:uncharacterized protein YndB with AHSA1/START domain
MTTRIEHWDARTGGSWRYASVHDGTEYRFRGCFHEVRPDRIQFRCCQPFDHLHGASGLARGHPDLLTDSSRPRLSSSLPASRKELTFSLSSGNAEAGKR